LLGALAAVSLQGRARAGAPLLFTPNQLDFHYHSGLEREPGLSIDAWIDRAVARGRRCFLAVDHLELYRPEPYKKYVKEPRYPPGPDGLRQFLKDVDRVRQRRDVLVFSGWEVIEGEIDAGLDWEALGLVDAVGWHIGHHGGHELLRRIRTVKEVQKRLPIPMILYHPFRKRGPRPETSEGKAVADLRCLTPEVQREMIDLLGDSSIHLEINVDWVFGYKWRDPKIRQAHTEDVRPLAEAGLSFTIGSDDHRFEDQTGLYDPDLLCATYGITARQVNRIVGEILTHRALSGLASPSAGER
jgi:histidinol phosphatase-like PHP family hydrolase